MSNQPESKSPLAELDLDLHFLPAWAQQAPDAKRYEKYTGNEESGGGRGRRFEGRGDRGPRPGGDRGPRRDGPRGPGGPRPGGDRGPRPGGFGGPRPQGGGGRPQGRFDDRRGGRNFRREDD